MTSGVASHYRRTGRAKVSYETKAEAEYAAVTAGEKYFKRMKVYKCPLCKKYHLATR